MENKICSARSAIGNRISADHETAPKGTDKWKKNQLAYYLKQTDLTQLIRNTPINQSNNNKILKQYATIRYIIVIF